MFLWEIGEEISLAMRKLNCKLEFEKLRKFMFSLVKLYIFGSYGKKGSLVYVKRRAESLNN